ncbi:MAG: hypothetical protein MNSN_02090 [Minisyncoccus archaeiphilus]|uniref:prepilin-type N-terminal cleavage/methylation domain-containing protein n=1 Tax=Minisyncoccus archaeiphilus TaxID=3238481 RepID=UPI002B165890|nr:MAG: hypothetical protein MNSN_02090 [Candidatus Parcubacteria bacterium]
MNTKSFTLIELLVVIAIIGILAGIIIVSMGDANNSAKDAVRKADVNQLSKSIMIYKTNNPETELPKETCSIGSSCSSNEIFGNGISLKDPSGTNYTYSSLDGIDYTVTAKLSDENEYVFDSATGKYGVFIPSGEWVNTGLGFQVMKYEAKNVNGKASSVPEGSPWDSITQNEARIACEIIGAHLITNAEWTALARSIESVSSNWSGGAVGSGTLSIGFFNGNNGPAPLTGPGYEYRTGVDRVGPSGDHLYKRTYILPNGGVVWDLGGNVYEWTNDNCLQGSGEGNWYYIGSNIAMEWTDSNLIDYEKGQGGPIGNYDSTNGIGKYYGCSNNGFIMARSGSWGSGLNAGIFALTMNNGITASYPGDGFRCAR